VFEGVERGRTLDRDLALHLWLVEHESRQLGKYLARRLSELRHLLLRRRLNRENSIALERRNRRWQTLPPVRDTLYALAESYGAKFGWNRRSGFGCFRRLEYT